jgi:hypothetical protein
MFVTPVFTDELGREKEGKREELSSHGLFMPDKGIYIRGSIDDIEAASTFVHEVLHLKKARGRDRFKKLHGKWGDKRLKITEKRYKSAKTRLNVTKAKLRAAEKTYTRTEERTRRNRKNARQNRDLLEYSRLLEYLEKEIEKREDDLRSTGKGLKTVKARSEGLKGESRLARRREVTEEIEAFIEEKRFMLNLFRSFDPSNEQAGELEESYRKELMATIREAKNSYKKEAERGRASQQEAPSGYKFKEDRYEPTGVEVENLLT